MWASYLFLAIAALLPVAATVIFHFLNKYTKFNKLPYWPKQIIYGVVFGGLAITGTHWSIPFNGAAANARDAAVIIGSLIFGGPAGVVAGTIGGIERMIVGLINPTKFGFTVIACSVSTFLAGVVSALVRKLAFENKRPGIISGFFTGLVIEVFHLFMVFVTNANEYQKAYQVVQSCTPPMLIANSFAVLIGILVINVLEKGKDAFNRGDAKSLTSRFTVTLSALTFIAFILSSTFVFLFNNEMVKKQTNNDLSYAVRETRSEVNNKTIEEAYVLQEVLGRNQSEIYLEGLQAFCDKEGLTEINIIKHDGEIWHSSEEAYDVATRSETFNMYDFEQSAPFCAILKENGPETFVQEFRQMADSNKGEVRKYAAIRFEFDADGDSSNGSEEKGMLQFGYNIEDYAKLVKNIANYKNIGQSGALMVLSVSNINELIEDKSLDATNICYETIRKTNFELKVVSASNNASLPDDFTPIVEAIKNNPESTTFQVVLNGKSYYAHCKYNDVHMILSIITTGEADLSRNISIFVNTFLEIIVFGCILITSYILSSPYS